MSIDAKKSLDKIKNPIYIYLFMIKSLNILRIRGNFILITDVYKNPTIKTITEGESLNAFR